MSQHLTEDPLPSSGPNKSSIDVSDSNVRDHINSHLSQVTFGEFITPYVALNSVQKTLSVYHISIPGRNFLEGSFGSCVWPVHQFGDEAGIDVDGQMIVPEEPAYSIYFEYQVNEDGMFNIWCEILDKEELDQILADLEDELNDEEDPDEEEELSEETINEISKKLAKNYLDKAIPQHGDYNTMRRNEWDPEKKATYARKEKNRREGISRASDKVGKMYEGNDVIKKAIEKINRTFNASNMKASDTMNKAGRQKEMDKKAGKDTSDISSKMAKRAKKYSDFANKTSDDTRKGIAKDNAKKAGRIAMSESLRGFIRSKINESKDPPFDADEKPSTPFTNPKNKAKQLARAAMRQFRDKKDKDDKKK